MRLPIEIKRTLVVLSLTSYAAGLQKRTESNFQTRCANLKNEFKPDNTTTVLISEYLPSGTNWTIPPEAIDPSCTYYFAGAIFKEDSCRLKLNISTSKTSNVVVEILLPVDWNERGKRVITLGNGGLNGCIAYGDLVSTNSLGFVAIGTNNGHDGGSGAPFFHNTEVLEDFVYRSRIVVGTDVGKKATKHLYGSPHRKAYFMGCSTGGRQGLKAAQDFPEEFDGILAGAAANDFLDLEAANGQIYAFVGNPGSPSYINADQWDIVHKLVLSQCDWIDGAYDGIIEDPMKCRPRFETLLCDVGQTWASNKCLTSGQINGLIGVYSPIYGSKGEFLYPRMQPGGEIQLGESQIIFGPGITVDWLRYVVLNNTKWDFNSSWSLEVFEIMKAQDSFGVSTWNPDLSKLRNSRHKLITYHGLMDGSITSENSYRYYDYVSRTMNLTSKKLDDFYRFFPVSGMSHCSGGDGAWYIGASGQSGAAFPLTGIPKGDGGVLMDLVRWVEDGVAPETVLGTSIGRQGEQITRKHCKYPLKNTYKGSGNFNSKDNWRCA
ncbi:Tannase and feruloyl esterase [Orbilia ellipsospora]|uniref:Carboxylic ester hydrolase n=1 Tax=Orbilia ellipsospora TaxID=2528407 RepID=A0AAV9WWM6_9PEZI